MIDSEQLKEYIIEPVLEALDMKSKAAINLLLGTAAAESRCGYYLHQVKGPALGIYQIEPATHSDVIKNYINYRPMVASVIDKLKGPYSLDRNLIGNLYYSTAIARLIYYRSPHKLPSANDIEGLGAMWKEVYNTHLGAGTTDGFTRAYNNYIKEGA